MKIPRSAALTGLLVLAADQITKALAGHAWVSEGVAFIHPLANPGLTLQVADASRWSEVALMAAVWLVAAWFLMRLRERGSVYCWSVGLVLGGAFGNMVDRAAFGSVRDFLVLGPVVVNVADIAVLAGLVALYVRPARRSALDTVADRSAARS